MPKSWQLSNSRVSLKTSIVSKQSKNASSRWRRWLSEAKRAYKVLLHLESNCPRNGYSAHWSKEWATQKSIVDKQAEREQSMARIRAAARYTRNDERSSKQFLSQFKSRSASKSLNSVSNSAGTIVEPQRKYPRHPKTSTLLFTLRIAIFNHLMNLHPSLVWVNNNHSRNLLCSLLQWKSWQQL